MADNNLRITQSNDFEVVKGDTLVMPFEIVNFTPLDYDMEMDVVDPYTKKVIPMALGTTYSKQHNDGVSNGEGIYYRTDSNIPSGVALGSDNQIAVKLDSADTELLEGNQSYNYDIRILKTDGSIVATFVQGKLFVLARALDA